MSSRLFDDLLKVVIMTFYSQQAIVIVNYMLFHRKVQQHHMVQQLALPSNIIRQVLRELQSHGIVISQQGIRDRRHQDRTGNMFTRGPDQGRMIYWSFDPDYKNVISYRIIQLLNLLHQQENEAYKRYYYCQKCSRQFEMSEVMPRMLCLFCPNQPLLAKEFNMEQAKVLKKERLAQIQHLQTHMKECLSDISPMHPQEVSSSQLAVTIKHSDLMEIESTEEVVMVNQGVLKYYKRLHRKAPKSERRKLVSPRRQAEMGDQEFLEYFRTETSPCFYLK